MPSPHFPVLGARRNPSRAIIAAKEQMMGFAAREFVQMRWVGIVPLHPSSDQTEMRSRTYISTTLAVALLGAASAGAQSPGDFFAGKTITISTYGAPGDSYDVYMRLLARHYGPH